MDTHPLLAPIAARLEHGESQFRALTIAISKIDAPTQGQPTLREAYDPDRRVLSAYIDSVSPPPSLGLLVGDVVHTWRSSLDNLLHCMLDRNGWPPTRRNQFPIESVSNSHSRRALRDQTNGIRGSDLAAIEALQPFTLGEDADGHPLAALRDLSNYDKHRVIIPSLHSYAIKTRLTEGGEWVPITDVRLAFRPGVETPFNSWLQGVIGADIEKFAMHGPNPENHILDLTLVNVTQPVPKLIHSEISLEYSFWSPTNAANLSRLAQVRDALWAILRETSTRWAAEDSDVDLKDSVHH